MDFVKDSCIENEKSVDVDNLKTGFISDDVFDIIHRWSIIACADVFVEIENSDGEKGILLVKRLVKPLTCEYWPLGGKIDRGEPNEIKTLKKKALKEAGLKLHDITLLGIGRTLFDTDPRGHGKGTDSRNTVYFAKSDDKINLDDIHERPIIVTPEEYPKIKDSLHPYVRDFMDKAILMVGK